jgi:hypothetical protein
MEDSGNEMSFSKSNSSKLKESTKVNGTRSKSHFQKNMQKEDGVGEYINQALDKANSQIKNRVTLGSQQVSLSIKNLKKLTRKMHLELAAGDTSKALDYSRGNNCGTVTQGKIFVMKNFYRIIIQAYIIFNFYLEVYNVKKKLLASRLKELVE